MFVVDKGVTGPELAADLFAGEDLAGALQQQEEYLEGLRVELYADA